MVFQVVMYDGGSGLQRRLSAEELILSNSGAGEDSLESLGLQRDQISQPKENQPWIFIGRTDAETEAPILWLPDAKSRLLGKTLMLRKTEGMRRRRPQRTEWLDGIINLMNMSLSKLQELVKDKKDWHAAVHGITKSQTLLSDWTTNNCNIYWNWASMVAQMIKVGNTGSIPGLGRSPGEKNGNQLQYSWLENSMNRSLEVYCHGVTKGTQLSN